VKVGLINLNLKWVDQFEFLFQKILYLLVNVIFYTCQIWFHLIIWWIPYKFDPLLSLKEVERLKL